MNCDFKAALRLDSCLILVTVEVISRSSASVKPLSVYFRVSDNRNQPELLSIRCLNAIGFSCLGFILKLVMDIIRGNHTYSVFRRFAIPIAFTLILLRSPGFKPRTLVPLNPLLPQITPESGIAGWTVS